MPAMRALDVIDMNLCLSRPRFLWRARSCACRKSLIGFSLLREDITMKPFRRWPLRPL